MSNGDNAITIKGGYYINSYQFFILYEGFGTTFFRLNILKEDNGFINGSPSDTSIKKVMNDYIVKLVY